jgi:hypothetical protein
MLDVMFRRTVTAWIGVAFLSGAAMADEPKSKTGIGRRHEVGEGDTIHIKWQPVSVAGDMVQEIEDYNEALTKWKQGGKKGPEPKEGFFSVELVIDKTGAWQFTGKVALTPCSSTATSCAGVIDLGFASSKGEHVSFSDAHKKVTAAGYTWTKQGMSKLIAEHFADYKKGRWAGAWRFIESDPGMGDIYGGAPDVTKVIDGHGAAAATY